MKKSSDLQELKFRTERRIKVAMDETNEPKEDGENGPSDVKTGEKDEPSPAPFGVHQTMEKTNKSRRMLASGFIIVITMADVWLAGFGDQTSQITWGPISFKMATTNNLLSRILLHPNWFEAPDCSMAGNGLTWVNIVSYITSLALLKRSWQYYKRPIKKISQFLWERIRCWSCNKNKRVLLLISNCISLVDIYTTQCCSSIRNGLRVYGWALMVAWTQSA